MPLSAFPSFPARPMPDHSPVHVAGAAVGDDWSDQTARLGALKVHVGVCFRFPLGVCKSVPCLPYPEFWTMPSWSWFRPGHLRQSLFCVTLVTPLAHQPHSRRRTECHQTHGTSYDVLRATASGPLVQRFLAGAKHRRPGSLANHEPHNGSVAFWWLLT